MTNDKLPTNLLYTSSHEWIKQEDNGIITIGITEHAQDALGDIVFIELPTLGKKLQASQACCVIESVKAASDIYSPTDGEVVEINQNLVNNPNEINTSPYESWIFKLKIETNNLNLLSAEQYLSSISS